MKTLLLVPIQTDGLFLSEDTLVTEASADFSRLPYFNGTRDVNADVANISESIVSQPLQDQNLRLKKGLHLHWALPDALNRGTHLENGRTEFPVVPNRWLVTRRGLGAEKSWVIESDYLFPEEKYILAMPEDDPIRVARRESITVPVPVTDPESGKQPFRYMGRKIDAVNYPPADIPNPLSDTPSTLPTEYYPRLTTVGYGEPSFAAFYPNCHSVFGFHDPEIAENIGQIEYNIIGWYSDTADEFYDNLVKNIPANEIEQYLKEQAGWILLPTSALATQTAVPDRTLLYTRFVMASNGAVGQLPRDEVEGIAVVLGNTGTEALSVFLSKALESTWAGASGKAMTMEEQLEALYLLDKLDNRVLDLDAKFDESRHENGFNSIAGGYLWTISAESGSDKPANAGKTADKPALPAKVADMLNEVNRQQAEYDQANFQLQSLGTQLFADWYKYMVSTYPPEDTRVDYPEIDEVRFFIEEKVMGPLRIRDAETGELILATSDDIASGKLPASSKDGSVESVATKQARAINNLFSRLTALNSANAALPKSSDDIFVLKRIGGPRYWEPTEPVVLLANDAPGNSILKPTDRHGRDGRLRSDGLLECYLSTQFSSFDGKTLAGIEEILAIVIDRIENGVPGQVSLSGWTEQPWNPFRLDWEVELAPLSQGTNMEERDYEPDFLTKKYTITSGNTTIDKSNFTLPVNATDLVPEIDLKADFQGRNPNIYVGRSLLTPQAKKNLTGRLETYLKENLLNPFLEKHPDHAAKDSKNPIADFGRVMAADLNISGVNDPVATALEAFFKIKDDNLHILSQALSGFNSAMVQLRQTFQLPIADPIGFKDYKPFTESVARLADKSSWLAPQPLTDFNPIRTGEMVINQLRLVDTFGQTRNIALGKRDRALGFKPTDAEITLRTRLKQDLLDPFLQANPAHPAKDSVNPYADFGQEMLESLRLTAPGNPVARALKELINLSSKIAVPLQPRLAQPARLHFRWLSANDGSQQMNDHPDTSPVCGWILTNQLDDSIVVYDAAGVMLGSIEAEADTGDPNLARWNPAPGPSLPVLPANISNPFLNKMVTKLRSGGPAFVAQFIDGLDTAMSTIEPETFESQQALSLLVGRPIALVRASLNLELQGVAAVDQGWNAFYRDRADGDTERNRDGFTKVKFPVRIGKHDQFNDGLVGYWKEDDNGNLEQKFRLNQLPLPGINHPNILLLNNTDIPVFQSIDDAPQLVSMLIDPRGKVHVTSGILPVKEISVPPDQYLPAMQRLGVTFLTSPLLTPGNKIKTLLPTEEGFDWSWIERRTPAAWREVFTYQTIEWADFQRVFSEVVFDELLAKKWVQPISGDDYAILPIADRPGLNDQFQLVEGEISTLVGTGASLKKSIFRQNLSANGKLGDRLWTQLGSPDIKWVEPLQDRPGIFLLPPKTDRFSQALPDFGMEFLLEEVLQQCAQSLTEPTTAADFEHDSMWIREGWLKLSESTH